MFHRLLKRVARKILSYGDDLAQASGAVIAEPLGGNGQPQEAPKQVQDTSNLDSWGTGPQRQRLAATVAGFDERGRQAVLSLLSRIAENFPDLSTQEIDALLSALAVAIAQSSRAVVRLATHVVGAALAQGDNGGDADGVSYLTPPRQYVAEALAQAEQLPLVCLFMCGRCKDITRIAMVSEAEKAQKKSLSAFVYAMQ